jgi:hypothetical protein
MLWSGASLANPPGNALPESLRTCASIKRSSERLACYDRTVEQLAAADGRPDATFKPSPEAMFGTTASKPQDASPTLPEREELSAVTARIATLTTDGEGMNVVELDNGQQWRQISGSKTLLLKEGDVVTITRAALNSFRLSTPSGRIAKVKRIR